MRFSTQSLSLLGLMINSGAQAAAPCIGIGGWSFRATATYNVDDEADKANDVQCTYETLRDAFTEQIFSNTLLVGNDCSNTAEEEFQAQLGVSTEEEAADEVYKICGDAQEKQRKYPLSDVTYSKGSQFIELYYTGHASWNEETETELSPGDADTPFNVLNEDAQLVDTYYEHSQKAAFEMPDLEQFKPELCTANAAMCCWPRDRQAGDNNGNCNTEYDENCIDKDVADNTDLCYVELTHAPYANGIDASGLSLFPGDNNNGEGAIHCHGFAWANDDQEITSRYKANNLFYVSMYDHMYQRGYVENIPGAPMCGCVEHMPVVSRSDCTQTNLEEYYTFTKKDGEAGFTGVVDRIKLAYQACQGAANTNNDLTAFVQQLVNDGKLTTAEQDIYSKRVVGNHQCNNAIEEVLDAHNFEEGFNVDSSKWTFIAGENFDEEVPIYDARQVKAMMEAQDPSFRIVRRVCPTCVESHRDIYYKRLTDMPDNFDLLDTLMNNWFDVDNEFNVDFALYSTYMDAYYDENRWTFCNFNDPGIGFPRDCGPNGRVNNNWNSYYRGGGHADYHAFMIPSSPLESYDPSSVVNIATDGKAYQSSTAHSGSADRAIDGNTVGAYHQFQSTTHTHYESNPWWEVDLGYQSTIDKVYFWNRIDCCRERLNGAVVSVMDLVNQVEVASVSIESAGVMNVVEFPGGAVGNAVRISLPGSGYLMLAEVQVDGVQGDAVVGNVMVDYFEIPYMNKLADIRNMDGSYKSDRLYKIDFPSTGGEFATSGRNDYIAALFKGFVSFEEEGFYDVCVNSDDGSKLYIDDELAIDNDGLHGMINKCVAVSKSGDGKEVHKITIEFFEIGGGAGCQVTWKTPDSDEYVAIPPTAWTDASDLTPTVSPTPAPSATNDIEVTYFKLDETFTTISDTGFDGFTPMTTDYVSTIDFPVSYGEILRSGEVDYVGALFEAALDFSSPGMYELCVDSSDGSMLYIDDELMVQNNGSHGMRKRCGTAFFDVGTRKVTIEYFESTSGGGIVVTWKKGEDREEVIPAEAWFSASVLETS